MKLSFFVLCLVVWTFSPMNIKGLQIENIIGGEEANAYDFRHVVAVMYKSQTPNMTDQNLCAGAIIDTWFISTAAHCFFNESGGYINKEFYIITSVIDLRNLSQLSQYVRVDLVIMPDFYNPRTVNTLLNEGNLAVVKLADRLRIVTGSRRLKKLRVAGTFGVPKEPFNVAGYGWNSIVRITDVLNGTVTNMVAGESDGKLRFAAADYISQIDCHQIVNTPIPESNMCIKIRQDPGRIKGVCVGDIGAPLTEGDYLIGIVVRSSPECNELQIPAIYLKISSYAVFIKDVLKGNRVNARTLQLREYPNEFRFVEI